MGLNKESTKLLGVVQFQKTSFFCTFCSFPSDESIFYNLNASTKRTGSERQFSLKVVCTKPEPQRFSSNPPVLFAGCVTLGK
jgi:hypothetical protein